MCCYIGLDPGGKGAFGWCVAEGTALPLRTIASGVADYAQQAVSASLQAAVSRELCCAGVDAPLTWRTAGDRDVDRYLRQRVLRLGGSGGTVGSVNSLRGACLIQGMMAATLLRERKPNLPISESHPKAMLRLLGIANAANPVNAITSHDLEQFLMGKVTDASQHERDAALTALSAWAMFVQHQSWQDLYLKEAPNPLSPLSAPFGYWMPR